MKYNILSILAVLAMAMGFSACDDGWDPRTSATGELRLSSMGVDVDKTEAVISRAGSVDVSGFIVAVMQDGEVVKQWKYAEMPEIITLPVGEYSVKVYSHEPALADWECPYYEGTASFEIRNEEITEIGTVTCRFLSVGVTVTFSEDLRKAMGEGSKVTVYAGNTSLEFALNETRSAYFKYLDESMTLSAEFTGTISGAKATMFKTYNDVKPGNHYRIAYSLVNGDPVVPEEEGDVSVDPETGIKVNFGVLDGGAVDVGDGIEVEEPTIINPERPGQEGSDDTPTDPEPGDVSESITMSSPTLTFDGVNTVSDDLQGIVNIHSAEKIAHLNVKIESDNANFIASAGELLPLEFDLANPGDNAEAFAGLGFPVGDQVTSQTDIVFDITTFIPLLGAFPGNHTFTLEVVDPTGASLTKVLKFKA